MSSLFDRIVERIVSMGHRSGDWTPNVELSPKRLVTGETVSAPRLLMCRRVDGRWEYRVPTPQEEAEYLSADAW